MKKYLIQSVVKAQPMSRNEAEARLGYEMDCISKEDEGYLIDNDSSGIFQQHWVGESNFKGKPFDSVSEQLYCMGEQLSKWESFINQYAKQTSNMSSDERMQIQLIQAHLKVLGNAVSRITNINVLKEM